MTTADTVLVPIQCEYYALEGLSQLIHTINLVRERLNPYLDIEGIVFTMFDARTNLSLQVVENVRANVKQKYTAQSYREMCAWPKRPVMDIRLRYTIPNPPAQRVIALWQKRSSIGRRSNIDREEQVWLQEEEDSERVWIV